MKNKQIVKDEKKSRRDYRSVEMTNASPCNLLGMQPTTKEANLRLAAQMVVHFSTERCKPTACAFEKNLLQVIYFLFLYSLLKCLK
jgi:hypothetical protein